MMYYSVRSIPKKMSRVTNYDVQYAGKSVFHIAFKASVLPSDTGTYSRYVSFIIPSTFQPGLYTFRATLRIGGRSATRSWRFAVSPTSATVAVDLTSQSGQTDKRFR